MSIPSQVLTQLRAIFEKDPSADSVALVWPEPLVEPVYKEEMNGNTLRIVFCPSELAIREQLVKHGAQKESDSHRLVLLSGFDQSRLAKDVLARLWKNEPQRINPWRTLEQILQVREIDPRLTKSGYRWIARTLLSAHEKYRNQIHFGEVLDLDKAWQALTLGLLNYQAVGVDLPSLFQWSLAGDCNQRFSSLPNEMREQIGDWLKPGIPEYEQLVCRILVQQEADNLLAIGLVCSVMYHPDLMGNSKAALKSREDIVAEQSLIASRAIFNERHLGGAFADTKVLSQFGQQALSYVEQALLDQAASGRQNSGLQQSFTKAEQMLASLDLATATVLSDILPDGFRLRLDAMATALDKAARGLSLASAKNSLQKLKNHRLALGQSGSDQIVRAEMAIRLCEWLQSDASKVEAFDALPENYIAHGSFADWARSKIWQGDVHEGLSNAYQAISEKVGKKREEQNELFSSLLPAIARGDKLKQGLLPVEQTLEQLLAPLAKNHPVLLLVLDGMSQAVYRELSEDLVQQNWIEWQRESDNVIGLVSVLPSITKASRCSLFSGAISEGVAADEKKAFAQHAALKSLSSTKFPPTLYHKADLQQSGSGALASSVRSVIAGTEHRITGVVINAIDDQLSSNAQLSMGWKLDTITLLRQVMEAAREAGRVVIMTSDHGHVLDHDMHSQGKKRWWRTFQTP